MQPEFKIESPQLAMPYGLPVGGRVRKTDGGAMPPSRTSNRSQLQVPDVIHELKSG